MFRRFGSRVTIVDMLENLMAREDPEISSALEEVFRSEGIALELGVQAQSIAKAGSEIVLRLANGKELRGSHLLVAVGRPPNTDDLGCEAGGIPRDKARLILGGGRHPTSAPGVY